MFVFGFGGSVVQAEVAQLTPIAGTEIGRIDVRSGGILLISILKAMMVSNLNHVELQNMQGLPSHILQLLKYMRLYLRPNIQAEKYSSEQHAIWLVRILSMCLMFSKFDIESF